MSIPPLKSIVGLITGDDFAISVIVPSGNSPETYEPTPLQIKELNESDLIFVTGTLPLEKSLLGDKSIADKICDLSQGIPLIFSHEHSHHPDTDTEIPDPHIWLSCKELRTMTMNAAASLTELYPDSLKYAAKAAEIIAEIDLIDSELASLFHESGIKGFMIYHPALTYLARDYGLRQVAIQQEGKEPSVSDLMEAIDEASDLGTDIILYQNEFPREIVDAVAEDTGLRAEVFNPLGEDIISEICRVSELICGYEGHDNQ